MPEESGIEIEQTGIKSDLKPNSSDSKEDNGVSVTERL